MEIELIRPLAFFDLETTGKDVNTAEIVEICIIKLLPNGKTDTYHTLVKPDNPIPPDATAVHHITDDMVASSPRIQEIADEIVAFFNGCDIGGYNSNRYDIPLLSRILYELSLMWPAPGTNAVDSLTIFTRKEGRSLKDAYLYYTGEVLEDAHSAVADVMATIKVFLAQMLMYKDLPQSIETLGVYSNYDVIPVIDRDGKFDYNEAGEVIFTFGANAQQPCKNFHSYLDWMMSDKAKFSLWTKIAAAKVKNGDYDKQVAL